MKKCLILANGNPPKKNVIFYLDNKGYSTLICADGGANSALKYDIIPDFIIGDLDSIKAETYDYFYDKCKILQIKRQNDTDVEKCLKFAIKQKYDEAVLLGGTGDRLDHSFCNLGIVLKFSDKLNIKVIHSKSLLSVYKGKVKIKSVPGETFSIYGFDGKTKIKSKGLKYPLTNFALPFGERESTSNVAKSTEVYLEITGGKVFVIRDFELMKSNGLF